MTDIIAPPLLEQLKRYFSWADASQLDVEYIALTNARVIRPFNRVPLGTYFSWIGIKLGAGVNVVGNLPKYIKVVPSNEDVQELEEAEYDPQATLILNPDLKIFSYNDPTFTIPADKNNIIQEDNVVPINLTKYLGIIVRVEVKVTPK